VWKGYYSEGILDPRPRLTPFSLLAQRKVISARLQKRGSVFTLRATDTKYLMFAYGNRWQYTGDK